MKNTREVDPYIYIYPHTHTHTHIAPAFDTLVKMSDDLEYPDRFQKHRVPRLLRNIFCVPQSK